jgi:hypothetical protein
MMHLISNYTRVLTAVIFGVLVFAAPNQGFAQDKKVKLVKAGTLEVKGGSVGFLVGFRWGTGTLTLNNGTKLKFSFKGLKALETGAAEIKAVGTVYNLKKPADFEGTFTGFSGGMTLGKELFGFINLENSRGVIVSVKSANKGVRLSAPGPGGVHVSFQR